jgi:hypothetical protein
MALQWGQVTKMLTASRVSDVLIPPGLWPSCAHVPLTDQQHSCLADASFIIHTTYKYNFKDTVVYSYSS